MTKFLLPRRWLLVVLTGLTLALASDARAQPGRPVPKLDAEPGTILLLEADAAKGTLVDRTGRFTPTVTGGTIVEDGTFGPCLKLGDGDTNGITVKDDGKVRFDGGVTLDAWVRLDELPPAKGAAFAMKVGSFSWDVTSKGKLNVAWMVFPSEEIATTTKSQFKYYPVGGEMINGLVPVPLGKWFRVTIAYDQALGAVTTQIDGRNDRSRHRYRGPEPMQADGKSPFTFLQGFKNARLGALRIKTGRPRLAPPTLDVFVNALPYQDRVMLTFDHIDPDLPLPIDATVVFEKPNGEMGLARSITLDSHAKKDVMLDLPTWKNTQHTAIINASAGGRSVFSKAVRIASVAPDGPVRIHLDRTLSKDGKKFFPIMVYHAMPDDFPLLADLGFNVLLNDFNLGQHSEETRPYGVLLKETLDAAQKANLLVWTAANAHFNSLPRLFAAKGHPAAVGWYGADEPWGELSRLVENYNTTKMLEPNLPILIIQNNYSRLQETAQGTDIIGTDPYPIPNVSLRAVADATRAAIRSVSGQKPVWTVIPQYAGKVPTRDELLAMTWIAIASGADGIGLFDWDERVRDKKTNTFSGWYTREHPDAVENVRVVLKELRRFEPILLSPRAAVQPKQTNLAIHALVKESEGKHFLVIANDSRRAEETTLRMEINSGEARRLDADAEPLPIRGGELAIRLPPLGVAIYELVDSLKK